jgi:hypothetical protein
MKHLKTIPQGKYRVEVFEIPPTRNYQQVRLLLAFPSDEDPLYGLHPRSMMSLADRYVMWVETLRGRERRGAATALFEAARQLNGGWPVEANSDTDEGKKLVAKLADLGIVTSV